MPRKAFTLTPEEAKRKVLEHWQQLDALARRRFPQDENLAHEGLLYVMDKLVADEWRRVCAWQGLEEFSSFLVAVASRLLTDFTRRREGYARFATPPVDSKLQVTTNQLDKLIAEIRALPGKPVGDHLFSDDEFISYAMETLEPQQIERIDAHLASCPECATEMERLVEAAEVWRGEKGEQRLAALWARTREAMGMQVHPQRKLTPRPSLQEIDDFLQLDFAVAASLAPDAQLMVDEDKEMSEALQAYLQGEFDAPISPRVSELLARFRGLLRLSEEDSLLLRLRFQDGLTVQAIARRLHLEGDLHKRMNKLISRLRHVCLKAEKHSTGEATGSDVNASRNITERDCLAFAFREPDLTLRQAVRRGYITGRDYQALRRRIKKYLERDFPFLYADLIREGAVFLSPDEQIACGQKLLDYLKPALRESLCEAWQLCEKIRDEADIDPVELIATIAHVIYPVVRNVPATLIATILVNLGVRSFCDCHGHQSGSSQRANGKGVNETGK